MKLTKEQVAIINANQRNGMIHPLTCGGDRGDEAHRKYAERHGDTDYGVLIADEDGLFCPVCGYRQEWVPRFFIKEIDNGYHDLRAKAAEPKTSPPPTA